ncbi:hypothetical protein [Streptomyces sp. G45]|uniref:hypothetical protein n=1 Tax=Streptomyces sp. G45 TaxID=3406627 RepID=UPI003C181F62
MSDRQDGFRGAAGHAARVFVLRCAALLAVVLWALPVCAHAANEPPATAPSATAVSADAPHPATADAFGTSAHLCVGAGHDSGDTHCRASAEELTTGTGPNPSPPSPEALALVPAVCGAAVPAPQGPPPAPVRAPGIHQLQVQRT